MKRPVLLWPQPWQAVCLKTGKMFRPPPHLVQGEHGEHRPIVGFDSFQQQRFLPDVNVSSGSTREHQCLAAAVTHRHHGLRTPDAPEHTTLEGKTAAWRTEREALHQMEHFHCGNFVGLKRNNVGFSGLPPEPFSISSHLSKLASLKVLPGYWWLHRHLWIILLIT